MSLFSDRPRTDPTNLSVAGLERALYHADPLQVGEVMRDEPEAALALIAESSAPADNLRRAIQCLRARLAQDYALSEDKQEETRVRALLDRLVDPDTYTHADMDEALRVLDREALRRQQYLDTLYRCIAEHSPPPAATGDPESATQNQEARENADEEGSDEEELEEPPVPRLRRQSAQPERDPEEMLNVWLELLFEFVEQSESQLEQLEITRRAMLRLREMHTAYDTDASETK